MAGDTEDIERLFLDRAQRSARPWVRAGGHPELDGYEARVRARLEKGAREYEDAGDGYQTRTVGELLAELLEEGDDLGGWSTIILRRLALEPVDADTFRQAVDVLVDLAALGARVGPLVNRLERLLPQVGSSNGHHKT